MLIFVKVRFFDWQVRWDSFKKFPENGKKEWLIFKNV